VTSCSQLEDLDALVMGELEAAHARELYAHAVVCASCANELATLTAERELFARRAEALDATFVAPLAAFVPPPRAAGTATEARRVLPALGLLAMRGHFSAACAAALFVVAALSRLGTASMSASMNDGAVALTADETTAGSGAIASYRGDGETLACVLGASSGSRGLGAMTYDEDLATSSSSGATRAEVLACGGRASEGVIGGASCEPSVTCSAQRQ
jgi:anti-sigma factor RsiW